MKAFLIFAICAVLGEIAWCRPGGHEHPERVDPKPAPGSKPPQEHQDGNEPKPAAGSRPIIKNIVRSWEKLQHNLDELGGVDGTVQFLKSSDPALGNLLDLIEPEQGESYKPTNILNRIYNSVTSVNGVLKQLGGLKTLLKKMTDQLHGSQLAGAENFAPPAPAPAPQQQAARTHRH